MFLSQIMIPSLCILAVNILILSSQIDIYFTFKYTNSNPVKALFPVSIATNIAQSKCNFSFICGLFFASQLLYSSLKIFLRFLKELR